MKKIITILLGSIVAFTLSISAAFATDIDKLRATTVPRIKLIIFFIIIPSVINLIKLLIFKFNLGLM